MLQQNDWHVDHQSFGIILPERQREIWLKFTEVSLLELPSKRQRERIELSIIERTIYVIYTI